MLQNTEGKNSFLWHRQHNYDINPILQIWVNAYLWKWDLIRAESRAYLLRRKARTSFLRFTRHVVRIFAVLYNKGFYIDHISGCNYVLKASPIFVCHALSRYASLNEHGRDVIRPLKNFFGGAKLVFTMDT